MVAGRGSPAAHGRIGKGQFLGLRETVNWAWGVVWMVGLDGPSLYRSLTGKKSPRSFIGVSP